MTRDELIASVALSYIKSQLNDEPEGTLRICMVGLEQSIVRAIALATYHDADTSAMVLTVIAPAFDKIGELPKHLLNDESITHWRHCRLPEGKRAVLFVASQDDLQRNDKSVEKITKIETDALRTLYYDWIDQAGLTQAHLDKKNRTHLQAALKAANESGAVRTIEQFSEFMLKIACSMLTEGLTLPKAVDSALPALRLPSFAGQFDRIAGSKRAESSEWAKIFTRLQKSIRPLLYRENERGESIDETLFENFKNVGDRLEQLEKSVIASFLKSDISADDWTDYQADLVDLNWRSIYEVFEGLKRTDMLPLGQRTLQFFDDEFDDLLHSDHRILLQSSFPKNPTDEFECFFQEYREHIARDKRLYNTWERYIYSNPQTFNDFFEGIVATLHRLRERIDDSRIIRKKIIVRIPRSREKSFWYSKNAKVVRYFAVRYRGIQGLFGEDVKFDFGKLSEFYFPNLDSDLENSRSGSRDARTLKFEVEFDPEGVKSRLMFIWEMPVNALATSMAADLVRIANENRERTLLPTADIARQSISARGQIQNISLVDVNTVRDTLNGNDGVMVAPNSDHADRADYFIGALSDLSSVLPENQIYAIRTAFVRFTESYGQAIRDWVSANGEGIVSKALLNQAEEFGELLRVLQENADNDRAREHLWKECLRIGTANVGSGSLAAIVLPWHPLRIAEIHIKAVQFAKTVRAVLSAGEPDIFRADLFFRQKQEELVSIYYPEVCVGFDGDGPHLLVLTETKFDYSLAEPAERQESAGGDGTLDIEPTVAARTISAIGEQFLKLLPHEQNNFSVVLYNAESKALPGALANELSNKVQQENNLQCDLLLTHADPMRMRKIYEQQNAAVGDDSGSVMASEAARNFLSRLRVGFLEPKDGAKGNDRVSDLVALQDVIARKAKVVWKKAPVNREQNLLEHIPLRWSRRKPVSAVDNSTSVYLTAPVQPKLGQIYLNAIQTYLHGDNAQSGNVIPAREVNFSNADVREVFEDAHEIGEWVVNFDELVDRRFLVNNGIDVIRHIHDRSIDRNITVSTTSKPRLLQTLLKERLDRIDPGIISTHGDEPILKFLEQATTLSGHVVMRAARYGHYANELLGVVLSMEMLKSTLHDCALPIGWYFLDDYASWFGQNEEQIADIMAIAPRIEEGKPVLRIAISEAKFVSSNSYRAQAKKSAKQLEETISRLGRSLDPSYKRIDRGSWLHRLGDFIIEGMDPIDPNLSGGWDLHQWSDEVRQDNVPIILAGFSHVFVHDDNEFVDAGDSIPLRDMNHCHQQIFDSARVAAALRLFAAGTAETEEVSKETNSVWAAALVSVTTRTNADRAVIEDKSAPNKEDVADVPVVASETETGESYSELAAVPQNTANKSSKEQPVSIASSQPPYSSLPSLGISQWIGKPAAESDEEAKKWLQDTVRVLQRALRSYEMTAELVGSRLTPNAALVRFRGSDNLTVQKVERRRQELFTSHAINVINVLAAPMEVIIMVGRPKRDVLHLKDLWRRREYPSSAPESNTSLLLGARESDGELLYLNVGDEFAGLRPHGPHTLIAGETGSGKGVLVQCLLLDICATNSPKSAHIRMIDPKAGIDFPWLRRMPHHIGDLITTREKAVATLNELVEEMERRNLLLADAGVTKLANYNKKMAPSETLPRIWLFHDELADWMLDRDYRDAIEQNVSRLGVKARAAGINLVVITQRPDQDVLPMQLRANLTNRLVLKVADKRNSILVLDEPGAERLLGRGHLAAKLSGEAGLMFAQVPFAEEEEVFELARLIASAWSDGETS